MRSTYILEFLGSALLSSTAVGALALVFEYGHSV
jgi:hypothetical protein